MRWLAKMTRIRMGTFSTIGTPFFFRLSNAKMMLRLIFIIGCIWNSTPKYTPNYWDSKRHLETFTFTLYCNLHLIISRLQFYDILWKYKFESLSLRTKRCNRAEFQQIASLFLLLYTILNYFNIIYPFTLYTTDLNCFRNHLPKHTPLQYRWSERPTGK